MELPFQGGIRGQAAILQSLENKLSMSLEGSGNHESFGKYYWLMTHRWQELSDKMETIPLVKDKKGEICSLHKGKSIEK